MRGFRERAVKGLGLLGICALVAAAAGEWFVFAVCCWAFLGVAFLVGVVPASRKRAAAWVGTIGVVHVGLLWAMKNAAQQDRVLGLPVGWALVVLGIWTAGILPNLVFSWVFDKWVLPPQAIDRVLAAKGRRDADR